VVTRLGAFATSFVFILSMFIGALVWSLGVGMVAAMAVGIVLQGFGFAAANSMQQARLVAAAPELSSATVALNTSSIYVGQALGSALGGFLFEHEHMLAVGYATVVFFGAALAVLALTRRRGTDVGGEGVGRGAGRNGVSVFRHGMRGSAQSALRSASDRYSQRRPVTPGSLMVRFATSRFQMNRMRMAPTVAPIRPAPWSARYQPMVWPRNVATKAPTMPRMVVRRKPVGLFGPGDSRRATTPARNPMMMIQMMLKVPSAGMGPQGSCGRPFQFWAAARSSVEQGKSVKLDAATSAKIGVGASGF
jgi:MFS family permease